MHVHILDTGPFSPVARGHLHLRTVVVIGGLVDLLATTTRYCATAALPDPVARHTHAAVQNALGEQEGK